MLDAMVVADAPKDKPLVAQAPPSGFTCVLCGVKGEGWAWRVTLPNRLGKACTGCAHDAGWEIQ